MKIKSKKTIKRIKLEEWRKKVLERDNYTDQITGKNLKEENKMMHVHHILDRKNFPELMFDELNGITLSFQSHKCSKFSPHLNSLWFAEWLKVNRPLQYYYLMNKMMFKKC